MAWISALESGRLAGPVAEMKDLNQTLPLMDLVVDENRAVDQFTHARPFANGVPHSWEPAKQIDVIQQGLAKTGSSFVVVLGDVSHDLGQIA
jgi:hypothetical protein